MMRAHLCGASSLTSSVAELAHLPRKHLVELWVKHEGRLPPKATSTSFLLRAAAYSLQEQQYGGLKRQDLRLLHKASEASRVKDRYLLSAKDGKASPLLLPRDELPNAQKESLDPAQRERLRVKAQPIALRPGTRLVREWQGKSHSVEVRAEGFGWNGHVYRSLSAVASAITGAHWSGMRFFRL